MKKEIVFFPYKASMWDSLESVWKAATKDANCDVYVVPIPYYDKNKDGSLGVFHYEGNMFPSYVPITDYNEYDERVNKPDVAYIHYPYDKYNSITCIDSRFFSNNLRKSVKCLVYIPYYATTGGMSEAQKKLPAYYNSDYIVIQSPILRSFFDESLPDNRFVPLGSPKFDRVINICNNPPEVPKAWKNRIKGRTVYFYNTSLGGILMDTRRFLNKMNYVFSLFSGRDDVCLIWRPHPLLESTLDRLRPEYKPMYDKLKQIFIEYNIGIYDDTPDVENTIALSDVYIGDSATSVTSLFGVVGKPLFILDNNIAMEPIEEDYRANRIWPEAITDNTRWLITSNNHLLYSCDNDFKYRHVMKLSCQEWSTDYHKVIEVNGKTYVCPRNAQNILEIQDGKICTKIELDKRIAVGGAFVDSICYREYIYLIPLNYPAVVRLNTTNNQVDYIESVVKDVVVNIDGAKCVGGRCIWKNYLVMSSPHNDCLTLIDAETLEIKKIEIGVYDYQGSSGLQVCDDNLYIFPGKGTRLIYGNPLLGMFEMVDCSIDGFECTNRPHGFLCDVNPFSSLIKYGNRLILSPAWGNMFIEINFDDGSIREWEPPFPVYAEGLDDYYYSGYVGRFMGSCDENGDVLFYADAERCIYKINIVSNEFEKITINIPLGELEKTVSGYGEYNDWLQYGCQEDAFNTLRALLDNKIKGGQFDKEKQIEAYARIASNSDGTAGEKIHEFIMGKI